MFFLGCLQENFLFIYTVGVGEGVLKLGYTVPTLSTNFSPKWVWCGQSKRPSILSSLFFGFGFPSLSLFLVWTLRASLVDIPPHLHCLPLCPKELNAGQDSQRSFTCLTNHNKIQFHWCYDTTNCHNIFTLTKIPVYHRSKENYTKY